MAVAGTKITTALVIKVKTGVLNGQDVFKSLTFKRVKGAALDQEIFDVAEGIATILGSPVNSIYKQDVNELTNA
jgi:hypothetical protein